MHPLGKRLSLGIQKQKAEADFPNRQNDYIQALHLYQSELEHYYDRRERYEDEKDNLIEKQHWSNEKCRQGDQYACSQREDYQRYFNRLIAPDKPTCFLLLTEVSR